jgi:hypothetical protein
MVLVFVLLRVPALKARTAGRGAQGGQHRGQTLDGMHVNSPVEKGFVLDAQFARAVRTDSAGAGPHIKITHWCARPPWRPIVATPVLPVGLRLSRPISPQGRPVEAVALRHPASWH